MRFGGRPGVLSARFGGEDSTTPAAMPRMLRDLEGVPPARRTARYRALIALPAPAAARSLTEGRSRECCWTRRGARAASATIPLFFYPPLDATFAEIPAEAKHAVSHRGRAMAQARALLQRWTG